MSIVFVKMRFQYLEHSLQKRMVCHSNQLLEAIIKLWQRGYPYSRIIDTINDSVMAQIFKGTVAYQVKKFQETNSVETIKKLDSLDLWGCLICKDQKKPKLSTQASLFIATSFVWTNQAWTELWKRTLFFEQCDIKIESL